MARTRTKSADPCAHRKVDHELPDLAERRAGHIPQRVLLGFVQLRP